MKLMKVKSDFVFKKIFGEPGSEDILISLLRAILDIDIKQVTIDMDKELPKDLETDKTGILDVKATLGDGTKVNIEIQVGREYNLAKRTFFYLSKLYSNGFDNGTKYNGLNKTITINILDYSEFDKDGCHSIFKLKDQHCDDTYFDDVMEIHVLELDKIEESGSLSDMLCDWLTFIGTNEDGVREMLSKKAEAIKKAYEKLEHLSQDKAALAEYESREKFLRDYNSNMYSARMAGIEEGKAEGKTEGKTEALLLMLDYVFKDSPNAELIKSLAVKLSTKEIDEIYRLLQTHRVDVIESLIMSKQ